MKKNKQQIYYLIICMALCFTACKKKTYTSDSFIVKQWPVMMSALYTIPGNTSRAEHAVAELSLMSDNQLYYDVYFDSGVNSSDIPGSIQLFSGSAVENGTLLLDLHNGTFDSNREVKGNVTVDAATAAKLLSSTANLYMQVNSAQIPAGLVRGQMDKTITAAYDVALTKYSSTVNTTATGTAYIRVFSDNNLAYQVVINNQPAGDVLTAAHIHKTLDNSILTTLAVSASDFNKPITTTTAVGTVVTSLSTDNLYIDVHSMLYGGGLLKGIIR